ncbi:hypothetical protein ABZ319_24035 [Nocardia sp. NPDC005978]|uniref:hypothetical protein n=1 Tax=Nocardia sp. NPDC005978 TaxID=3156725 RepID=UPI0033B5CF62
MKDLVDPGIDIDSDIGALTRADTSLLLSAAEEAEADAAAAEAMATAARARARAVALRRRAEAVSSTDVAPPVADDAAETTPSSSTGAEVGTSIPSSEGTVRAEPAADDAPTDDGVLIVDLGTDDTDPGAKAEKVTESATARTSDDAVGEPGGSRLRRWVSRARSGGRRTAVLVLATAVVVASLAVGVFSVWNHQRISDTDRRTAEFSAAAKQGVVALTSLDFNRAKDDVQRVLDNSTGAFRDDFQSRAEDFTKVVEQSQVTTEGRVNATAVESMTEDSAVVLVAATSQITNSAGAKQEPRVWRLSVTVTRVDGQLKMSKVEFVP